MNEEDIIDILENVFIFKNANDNFTRLDLDAINGLLKLYKQEKEKNKKLEDEVKCFRDSYEEARIEECDNYFILNRIINLMAEDLKKNVDVLYDTNKDIKDIKAYYFNKVKEKQDDK